MNTVLLRQLLIVQLDASATVSIPSEDAFTPSIISLWVNALCFTSLAVSLITAMISVLVKQWLHHYSNIPSGSALERCHIRQFRYNGLQVWHVPVIIGFLPVLLHVSLALFFAAIVLFLLPLQRALAWFITGLGGASYLVYVVFNLLPLWFPQCPYRTPLVSFMYSYAAWIVHSCGNTSRKLHFSSLHELELSCVRSLSPSLTIEALHWLYTSSSNPSVRSIVVQSIAGLPLSAVKLARAKFADSDILSDHSSMLDGCVTISRFGGIVTPTPGEETKLERLLRFELILPPTVVYGPLVPLLKVPEESSTSLTAVTLTGHLQNTAMLPHRQITAMQFLLDVLNHKIDNAHFPTTVWLGLLRRSFDSSTSVIQDNTENWVEFCASILDASASDWSSKDFAHEISPGVVRLREAIKLYLVEEVGECMLGAFNRLRTNHFSNNPFIQQRIQILLSILSFLSDQNRPSSSSFTLFLSVTRELERCVAINTSLTTVETHAIHYILERAIESFFHDSEDIADTRLWTARISILETYTILLGLPSRAKNGFLPLDKRVTPRPSAALQLLVSSVFQTAEWRSATAPAQASPVYRYFEVLCRFLRNSFKTHIGAVYEAFRGADTLRLARGCMADPTFFPVVEAYVQSGVDVDYYAHEPENLPMVTICLALGSWPGDRVLVRLRQMKMGDDSEEVWAGCLELMRGCREEWLEERGARVKGLVDSEVLKARLGWAIEVLEGVVAVKKSS